MLITLLAMLESEEDMRNTMAGLSRRRKRGTTISRVSSRWSRRWQLSKRSRSKKPRNNG